MKFTATVARGLEGALTDELRELGLADLSAEAGAVHFTGSLEAGYRACLWSRIAARVLLDLAEVPAHHADALYEGACKVRWSEHLGAKESLSVVCVGGNDAIRHRHFGAVRVKDAICDTLRSTTGGRPTIDADHPDVMVHVHVRGDVAHLAIDLSGPPLHLRGRDRDGGPAPLRETLAAGILRLSGWPTLAREGALLVDPMAGSGTIVIEAADLVRQRAPGLRRTQWGFTAWRGHDAKLWRDLQHEARDKLLPAGGLRVFASDRDADQVQRLEANLAKADMAGEVRVRRAELSTVYPAGPGRTELPHGLLVTNPPYGVRLGEASEVDATWKLLGDVLRRRFLGWEGWILAGEAPLAKKLGLRPRQRIPLFQGPLEGRLLAVPIADAPVARDVAE
jgi:23S rRNA (guanine2445-N2)-methyltransferase / 23S rRNA (guanine2069-N7)-methyltransferase